MMTRWEDRLALRHAPVLLQKVDTQYPRADFITNVDFAYPWDRIHSNWDAVWKKGRGGYRHALRAHGYYSAVETHTHYFLAYAFYHPQDWAAFWGNPADTSPTRLDQHLHDMEGCLAVVPKRENPDEERVEALLTISHYHFYSYAGWETSRGRKLRGHYGIRGWKEDVDGAIQVTPRFAKYPEEPPFRFKLYVDSGGHAIKGLRKNWGDQDHIIRYRPSLTSAEEPQEDAFSRKGDAYFQPVLYKLNSLFEKNGLWVHHDDLKVFRTNDRGQEAFVKRDNGKLVAGSANPPWGWDDRNDRHKPGEFAWDPAHLISGYFNGLREYSMEYVHNPYLGIIRKRKG